VNLSQVLRQWRYAERLELKDAARLIGINPSTLSRFERGQIPGGETLARIVTWLLEKPEVSP
jgi:transcriptional regulator with XRE-family HTH domain